MALKNLTSAEMIEISKPWTAPKEHTNKLLAKIAEVKGLIAPLKRAHETLLKAQQPSKNPNAAKLAEVSARGDALDTRHDAVVRGIYNTLTAVADLAPTPADAAPYLDTRDSLVPVGLGLDADQLA